eukprot:GHRR01001130.1.p1 GENE.GHRR01001130.1~~GHRR01001130.1.p1  ORF type:complete len:164 (+),score=10.13 GHRR01001130.1:275-766(+)
MQSMGASLTTSTARTTFIRTVARGRWLGRHMLRNALLAKMVPTATGYAFGDCLTQQLGPLWPVEQWPSKHNLSNHDWSKTALMACCGAFVGAPLSLALYHYMDAIAPGASFLLTAGKFTLDQVVGCVAWQAAYLTISQPYKQSLLAFLECQTAVIPEPVVATC